MRLDELFTSGGSIADSLRQSAIDILTPLLASKVPFVTIQSVIDNLKSLDTGIAIDRAFVVNLLDPDKVKSVKAIQGDRIILQGEDDSSDSDADQNEKEDQIDRIKNKAISSAKANVKKAAQPSAPPPPP